MCGLNLTKFSSFESLTEQTFKHCLSILDRKNKGNFFQQRTFVRELNGSGYFFSNGDHNRILLLHPSDKQDLSKYAS